MPYLCAICSVVLSLILAFNHHVMPDEAHTILLFQESHSLRELWQNLGFVGHPFGYYLFYWILYSVFGVAGVQVVTAFIAGCTSYLLARLWRNSWIIPLLFAIVLHSFTCLRSYTSVLTLITLDCWLLQNSRSNKHEPATVPSNLTLIPLLLLPHLHVLGMLYVGSRIISMMISHQWRATILPAVSSLLASTDLLMRMDSHHSIVATPKNPLEVLTETILPTAFLGIPELRLVLATIATVIVIYLFREAKSSERHLQIAFLLQLLFHWLSYGGHGQQYMLLLLYLILIVHTNNLPMKRYCVSAVLALQALFSLIELQRIITVHQRNQTAEWVQQIPAGSVVGVWFRGIDDTKTPLCSFDGGRLQPLLLFRPDISLTYPGIATKFRVWQHYLNQSNVNREMFPCTNLRAQYLAAIKQTTESDKPFFVGIAFANAPELSSYSFVRSPLTYYPGLRARNKNTLIGI